jgi:hypothetical protein
VDIDVHVLRQQKRISHKELRDVYHIVEKRDMKCVWNGYIIILGMFLRSVLL